ncbi:flagellar hook-length control protein FliK [Sulfuriflexus sp.]|uniref:flagellar hook-length control protein FliK n=1 Tax=Sulfuriflexus sp. TaxID=2015443 RepID=UPI0028CE1D90|nr:flagellar hook-length control protein FliK [Sulfuriflexus sp.]MDT8403900.1 flagellar hook-length control protein FliK [Sulfuriflexus sp.]
MNTVGPTAPPGQPLLSPSRPSELLLQLRSGQTLHASVERILPGGEADIRLGSSLLRVHTPVNLAVGQPLTLSVEITKQGPVLRASQEVQQLETIANAWRSAIPRQKPLAEVFTQLQQLLSQPASQQLPKPLHRAIQGLVQQAASVENLSRADNLRQVLQNAGTRLEARLLRASLQQQPPATQQDLKAAFLRVAQQVLQWQSQQPASPITAGAPGSSTNTASRAAGVELYHALLNAAGSKSLPQANNLPLASRPLLPPLPTAVPLASQDKPLFSGLQQLLERLLPASLSTPPPVPTVQAGANTANNNSVTAGQALLRIAAEILNQLESGLARIQQHQLAAVPGDEPVRTLLNVEIAVANNQQFGNVGVRIEQEDVSPQEQEKSKHNWRAVVNFDLPGLGKVQAIVSIQQHQVSTEFRSENDAATELFRQHIDLLEERLQEAGLKTGSFRFSTGETPVDIDTPGSSNLLNTEV